MARLPFQRAEILEQSSLLGRPWTEWLFDENEQKLGVLPGPSSCDGLCSEKSLLSEAHAATFLPSDSKNLKSCKKFSFGLNF